MTRLSLKWDTYKQNVCNGLCSLQQNGEFVDMTLAADGHHVKVHQLVMSLMSPYIKELISSAQCPHPVIFLNKVSYPVLCSILEYIYTGEVQIEKDHLAELIVASKELRITGLEEMKIDDTTVKKHEQNDKIYHYVSTLVASCSMEYESMNSPEPVEADEPLLTSENEGMDASNDNLHQENNKLQKYTHSRNKKKTIILKPDKMCNTDDETKSTPLLPAPGPQFQYCVTNQGSLQLILNRYLYYLRYTCKRNAVAGQAGQRSWRCVDFIGRCKCSAKLVTKDNIVLKRYGIHNHPFHDRRILKKVRNKCVFSALNEAETKALAIKCIRETKKDNQD